MALALMQPLSRHLTRLALAVGVASSAAAQYSSDFEGLTASAGGTPVAGQDNYYIPPVATTSTSVPTRTRATR